MMKILRRSWEIVLEYRTLWIFGFILAMTVGGSTFGSSGGSSGYQTNRQEVQNYLPESWNGYTFHSTQDFATWLKLTGNDIKELIGTQPEIKTGVGILVVFVILAILLGIGMTLLRYVSETSVIRMVDKSEASGEKVPFKQGFRLGWSRRSWRLFLLDLLLLFLPGLVAASLFILIGWGTVTTIIAGKDIMAAGLFLTAGLTFFLILVTILYFVLINFIRNFIVRTCVLEDVSVGESIKLGFSLVKKNWKDAGLMWLIMIGLGLAWFFVSIILLIILIPVLLVSVILGALVASIPGLLTGFLASMFVPSSFWAIVIGILFGLPFFLVTAGFPLLFVEGLVQVFKSTVWTLVYREIKPEGQAKLPVEVAEK
ncbi:hypothetical protein ACFLXB_07195 [Chloroflexota bacterium]